MPLSKKQIARQFSRAATTYNQVATIQNAMADQLIERIPTDVPGSLVDLGCGTGYALEQLDRQTRFQLNGIDIAPGMMEQCRRRLDWNDSIQLHVADLEQTPCESNSFDVAFSNAAIQWCDSRSVMRETKRILKPKGQLFFSTFGPQTLKQWKTAWQAIGDSGSRVHHFESISQLREALTEHDFHNIRMTSTIYPACYDSVRSMFSSIKRLGATNADVARPSGLLGKSKYRALCEYFENQLRTEEVLTLDFEAIFIAAELASSN